MNRQPQDKIMVRLPDGVRPRLKALAAANRRSTNAETILAIEAWLARYGSAQEAETGAELGGNPPVPASETAVSQGGVSTTHG